MRVINSRNDEIFLSSLSLAKGHWQQFAGLMLRPSLAEGDGLLFRPARGIHTHFMRFAIDLVYLDKADRVQAIRVAMSPWRFDWERTAAVIETTAYATSRAGLQIGDQLLIKP